VELMNSTQKKMLRYVEVENRLYANLSEHGSLDEMNL
jgi:hypothetical protein